MIIYQHNKLRLFVRSTKAFLIDDNNLIYKKHFEDFIKSDISLKIKIGIGISYCSKKDEYNRHLGRTLSTSRIQEELVDIVQIKICTEFCTFYLYSNKHSFPFKLRFFKTFLGSPRIIS